MAALGALVVNIADSQLLAAVVAAVRSWLAGSPGGSIKLELGGDALELTGVSSKEQRRLTDEWLARHAAGELTVDGTRSALIVASDQYTDPGLRTAAGSGERRPGAGGGAARTQISAVSRCARCSTSLLTRSTGR